MTVRDADHGAMSELAAPYVLGALEPANRAAFEAHLAVCGECAAEVRSYAQVPELLAFSVSGADPSETVRRSILSAIAAPAPSLRRSSVARDNLLLLAAAASIVLAVGLGAYSARLRERVADLEVRLAQETARATASEQQGAIARRVAAQAQSSVGVLTAPDLARIDLAGQALAPRASARAFWSRSRGLLITASNLPPLPAGRVYQLWVLTAQPAPISAGLLHPDASGAVTAMFETPPDLPKPVAMAVTIEPDGGVPAPTGDKYLVGLAD
jgi:anti-sigma-K factor RskA